MSLFVSHYLYITVWIFREVFPAIFPFGIPNVQRNVSFVAYLKSIGSVLFMGFSGKFCPGFSIWDSKGAKECKSDRSR